MQKGFAPIIILIGILLIGGIVGGVYYLKLRKTESFESRLSRQNPVIIPSITPQSNNKPTPDTKPQNDETTSTDNMEGKSCGGFAGEKGDRACPEGYYCKYPQPVYPDAAGKCVKK